MYEDASNNISMSQVWMKKYYDICHSRNFEFQVGDKVLKMVCKNIGRKGGKQEPKFTGLYEIVSISELGVARLKTERGCDLKTGVPIRQLQKYNDNEKNTERDMLGADSDENEMENMKPPLKRRKLFPDGPDSSPHTSGEGQTSSTLTVTPTVKPPPPVTVQGQMSTPTVMPTVKPPPPVTVQGQTSTLTVMPTVKPPPPVTAAGTKIINTDCNADCKHTRFKYR